MDTDRSKAHPGTGVTQVKVIPARLAGLPLLPSLLAYSARSSPGWWEDTIFYTSSFFLSFSFYPSWIYLNATVHCIQSPYIIYLFIYCQYSAEWVRILHIFHWTKSTHYKDECPKTILITTWYSGVIYITCIYTGNLIETWVLILKRDLFYRHTTTISYGQTHQYSTYKNYTERMQIKDYKY